MSPTILRRLKTLKDTAVHHQHKHSSIILYKGRRVSEGVNNKYKTHPLMFQYDEHKTIHSEIAALLKVKDKSLLPKCTLIVYRETRDGSMANSKPCATCQAILMDQGLTHIIYSTEGGWATL